MLAILLLKSELVIWLTGEFRKMVHLGFKNIGGFNNVIGAIDGTCLYNIRNCPIKTTSIQCQGIVDHRDIFIDYEIGWLRSVYDAKVYQNLFFYQNVSSISLLSAVR